MCIVCWVLLYEVILCYEEIVSCLRNKCLVEGTRCEMEDLFNRKFHQKSIYLVNDDLID